MKIIIDAKNTEDLKNQVKELADSLGITTVKSGDEDSLVALAIAKSCTYHPNEDSHRWSWNMYRNMTGAGLKVAKDKVYNFVGVPDEKAISNAKLAAFHKDVIKNSMEYGTYNKYHNACPTPTKDYMTAVFNAVDSLPALGVPVPSINWARCKSQDDWSHHDWEDFCNSILSLLESVIQKAK